MAFKIFEFAFCPYFDKKIETLALISPEKWSYQGKNDNAILKNYILHTFEKLKDEFDTETDLGKKQEIILKTDSYACFNTGLFTDRDETIYAYFDKK